MNTTKLQWRTAALSIVLAGASAVSFNAAATPKPPGLLTKVPGKVKVELPQQAIAGRSKAVKVNKGRLRSGRFFVELPDGVSFEAIRDMEYDFGGGKSAWVGHANGNSKDRVVIGQSGNALSATFAIGDRLFKLEPRANGSHVVSEVETTDPAPELDPIPVADVAGSGSTSAETEVAADGGADYRRAGCLYTEESHPNTAPRVRKPWLSRPWQRQTRPTPTAGSMRGSTWCRQC